MYKNYLYLHHPSPVIKFLHTKLLNNGDELLLFLEALSNPHRMRIISILSTGRQYVSQLAELNTRLSVIEKMLKEVD